MPLVARITDTVATGHGCDGTTTILGALQTTVFAEGHPIAVVGDILAPHTIDVGSACVAHNAVVNVGSGNVFIGGIAVARLGDSADAGTITGSASTVAVN